MNFQIISENSVSKDLLITKLVTETIPEQFDFIDEVADKVLLMNFEIKTFKVDNFESILSANENHEINQTNVIVLGNLLQNSKVSKLRMCCFFNLVSWLILSINCSRK